MIAMIDMTLIRTLRIGRRLAPLALALVVLLIGAERPAAAQVTAVSPYYVIVTAEDANLRCGAGSVWYAVAQAREGDMLRVDGHESGWLRVLYPSGTLALVRAGDARFDQGRGAVVLTRASRLFANNPRGGVSESWRALMDEELRPGTELVHVETVQDHTGAAAGYRVVAPEGARGFINELFVRRASEQEVAERIGAAREEPRVVAPESRPSTTPASEPEPRTDHSTEAITPRPVDEPTARPVEESRPVEEAPPTQTPAAPPRSTPAETIAPERPQPAAAQGAPTLAQLDAAYAEVMKSPIEEAEFDTLIGEYKRYMQSLSVDEHTERTRAFVGFKVEALEIRRELQDALRQMESTGRSAEQGAGRIGEMASELEARRRYTVVGRLSASTVYDGARLPLMYRVQSVEAGPGRTIAYLVPDPAVDMRGALGSIVGVIGEERIDTALQLPIIRPRRVDVLGAGVPAAQP